jgi:energy-coupling factor transporter ATP-binding protein EcfA2
MSVDCASLVAVFLSLTLVCEGTHVSAQVGTKEAAGDVELDLIESVAPNPYVPYANGVIQLKRLEAFPAVKEAIDADALNDRVEVVYRFETTTSRGAGIGGLLTKLPETMNRAPASGSSATQSGDRFRFSFALSGAVQFQLRVVVQTVFHGEPDQTGVLATWRSKPVEVSVGPGFTLDAMPRSAAVGKSVVLSLTPSMETRALERARVIFAGTEGVVVDRSNGKLTVMVPSLVAGTKPEILVMVGTSVVSVPYTGFIVAASGPGQPLGSPSSPAVAAAILICILLGVIWVYRELCRRFRAENARLWRQFEALGAVRGSDEPLPSDEKAGLVPEILPELRENCVAGNCVLFAGSGLATQAGAPPPALVLASVIDRAARSSDRTGRDWSVPRTALSRGNVEAAAQILREWLGDAPLKAFLGQASDHRGKRAIDVYDIVAKLPFAGVINAGWDAFSRSDQSLLARVDTRLAGTSVVAGPRSGTNYATLWATEAFERITRNQQFFFIDIAGGSDAPDALILTSDDYRRKVAENASYAKFATDCFVNRVLLFVGASYAAITDFLAPLPLPAFSEKQAPRHFALVPIDAEFEFRQEVFRTRYGIRLIGYKPTEGHPQVARFLGKLRTAVEEFRESSQPQASRVARLERISLRNIGPFQEFTIDLHEKKEERGRMSGTWNVFLGNNGCGKSTLLRAVALGLCGDDREAEQAGARLLKEGAAQGSIELTVGEKRYETKLVRETDRVLVTSSLTPLQVGRWVALGFPALRGASRQNPAGPGPTGRMEPVVRDVLPLLQGVVDWRLDNLKQWIVNLDTEASSPRTPRAEADRKRDTIRVFFDVLAAFVPGLKCSFAGIEPRTFNVLVNTDVGKVPIDQLSQGTGSILGWVGTLIERMYEIYPGAAQPTQEPALVLIDEIDAHMHPEWQQVLVPALKTTFPKLQVVATTHSPLIVLNMEPGEIVILWREGRVPAIAVGEKPPPLGSREGEIRHEIFEEPLKGQTASQALTGPLGLASTRDAKTARLSIRFKALAALPERTTAQERELAELGRELERQAPTVEQHRRAREARDLIRRYYEEQFTKMTPEEKERLFEQVRVELVQIESGAGGQE